MAKWIDYSVDERAALIAKVAKTKNIDDAAAEKDWWVTAVLYAVFHTSIAEYSLFKGGTSLSKGWDIISRFSEDIDIALNRSFYRDVKGYACADCASMTQIRNLREKNQDFIFGEFKNELCEKMNALGLPVIKVLDENEVAAEEGKVRKTSHDKDPAVLYVFYPSRYTSAKSYAKPVVKIEVSCLSLSEPYEMKPISSLVQQICSAEFGEDIDNAFNQTIMTVSPARTFLEKAFLLCEEFQKDKPRTSRMSRHLYDLDKLSHTVYMRKALDDGDLYLEILKHRQKFYHPSYVDYSKELPQVINFLPPSLVVDAFKDDYNNMMDSFIYEKDPLGFDELLSSIAAIQEQFRTCVISV
ncbi:MAG: nucleotidyl transferase AbiEii/AbiGii toxin family protein [Candidatus Cryptobacteroides sp.]